jgi:SAM-dependent methyltransferase
MARKLTAEILDELPADAPEAIRSRKDLQRLNGIMGHTRILAREARRGTLPTRVVELGSGDGDLICRLLKRVGIGGRRGKLVLVDRNPVVSSATLETLDELGWTVHICRQDVFEWARTNDQPFDICFANLFLHHFPDDALRELLGLIEPHTDRVLACEPRRSGSALWASRLVGLIGCNRVTRHDAVVSVEAGFNNGELTELWPDSDQWEFAEGNAGLFSHMFAARRK